MRVWLTSDSLFVLAKDLGPKGLLKPLLFILFFNPSVQEIFI